MSYLYSLLIGSMGGGQYVSITGSGFDDSRTPKILICDRPCSSVIVISAMVMNCYTPSFNGKFAILNKAT